MESRVVSNHFVDSEGNPAGGTTFGNGFAIGWQNGPLGRGDQRTEPNGAFVEHVILAAMDRLAFYQRSKFACDYNARAIEGLATALTAIRERTADRDNRGVEGTHDE